MPKAPVIEALAPRPGQTIADVGAGLGWLSWPLAEAVGPSGHVWAIDPSAEAVQALSEKALTHGVSQLQAVRAFAEAIPLPGDDVDGVVWHTVALHMGDRVRAMAETMRILKPGGFWVAVDWKIVPTPFGPPLHRRVSAEVLEKEALTTGFRLVRRFEPGPVTWGLIFQKD
ncbi:methyltransferase domain-containing protein [Sulfobacillus sp. DSM 109850]|uniref:Methyltransferase domain-containing protein n=2 Tax=Sulfobacillus harzensis TaxID=2729629 RepID=A0A7Y0L558_9FIRM|nr:methyltransferase domain-containing protein [Sulfobacillus harzensis]